MKVLHIWDQGIGATLKKYLSPRGVICVGVHNATFDPYNMTPPEWRRRYGWYSRLEFKAETTMRSLFADVVHIHSRDVDVPRLKALGNRVVLHYHGSDIRGKWRERKQYWESADVVLVSTRDLLDGAPPSARYQPNPVNTELFYPDPALNLEMAALYMNCGAVDVAEEVADRNGLRLVVLERGVPYYKMPRLLGGYWYFVDVKRDDGGRLLYPTVDTYSLTGLQALACGCTVLNQHGRREGLPVENEPHRVAEQIKGIYEEIV